VSDVGTGCIGAFAHDRFQSSLVTAVSLTVLGRSITQYREPCTLTHPTGIAVSQDGTVFVAETSADEVDRIGPGGPVRDTWGTVGQGLGRFAEPVALALGAGEAIYVADRVNNCIQKLSPQGEALSLWGGPGPHDRSSAPGRFRHPSGVAVDRVGNVYVADTGNDRIEEFSATGKLLAIQGRTGSRPGQFRHPTGIAVDAAGDVYVADTDNNRVQKIVRTA
jgi:DNA-binding beta-propeller fold protein YncE